MRSRAQPIPRSATDHDWLGHTRRRATNRTGPARRQPTGLADSQHILDDVPYSRLPQLLGSASSLADRCAADRLPGLVGTWPRRLYVGHPGRSDGLADGGLADQRLAAPAGTAWIRALAAVPDRRRRGNSRDQ